MVSCTRPLASYVPLIKFIGPRSLLPHTSPSSAASASSHTRPAPSKPTPHHTWNQSAGSGTLKLGTVPFSEQEMEVIQLGGAY
ncbi:hypothetical protein RI367_005056 [Sorochytrium milnesiophthora]